MDYDETLDKLNELTEKYQITLDETHRGVLKAMIQGWEKSRPVIVDSPDSALSRLSMVKERYDGVSSSSRSSSISDPSASIRVEQYVWTENYELKSLTKTINPSDIQGQLNAALEDGIPENTMNIDIRKLYSANVSENLIGSLANALSSYMLTLTGQTQTDNVVKVLREFESQRLTPYFKSFAEILDQDVRELMEQADLSHTNFISWLKAKGDEQTALYRKQAVASYPLLAPFMCGAYKCGDSYQFKRHFSLSDEDRERLNENVSKLMTAIDERQPIADIIQKDIFPFEISSQTLKNIGKIKNYPEGMGIESFVVHLHDIDKIDTNFQPKTAQELLDCMYCIDRAKEAAEILNCDVMDILGQAKGKWAEWREQTVSSRAIRDMKDWLKEVKRGLVEPLLWRGVMKEDKSRNENKIKSMFQRLNGTIPALKIVHDDIPEVSQNVLLSYIQNTPLTELVACSQKWHEDASDYRAQYDALGIAKYDELSNWMPLSEPLQSPDGFWVHPLTSRKALIHQGNVQGHCVGSSSSYFTQCLAGNDHIISLTRDKEGLDVLTTVQLREKGDLRSGITLEVIQHQGQNRRGPTSEESNTAQWYCDELKNNEDVTPPWKDIRDTKQEAKSKRDGRDIVSKVGFDPQDHDMCALAYDIIKPYLPKKLGKLHYENAMDRLKSQTANDNIQHVSLERA